MTNEFKMNLFITGAASLLSFKPLLKSKHKLCKSGSPSAHSV